MGISRYTQKELNDMAKAKVGDVIREFGHIHSKRQVKLIRWELLINTQVAYPILAVYISIPQGVVERKIVL